MNGNVDLGILIPLVIGGLLGVWVGVFLLNKLHAKHLENAFMAVLLLAACYMLAEAIIV